VLALRPDLSALPYPTLTLENAWSVGGDWKHHIQVADLDGEDGNEIYISGDYFGLMQCLEPTTLPGPWDCATFGGGSVHRGRGITYSPAYDASHIYVLDYVDNGWDQNGLRRCDFDGNCENVATNNDVQPLGGLPFDDPQDVAYAGAGVFYITDGYRQVIGRLEANPTPSSFSAVFGVDRVPYVTEPGYLNSPGSVIVDAQNNLYVTERAGRRIVSYDPAGNLRWAWGTPGVWMGAETEEMCEPQGTMSFDPAGNLYVADRCNGRVVILRSTDGSYLSSFRYFTEGGNLQGFDGPARSLSPRADACSSRIQIITGCRNTGMSRMPGGRTSRPSARRLMAAWVLTKSLNRWDWRRTVTTKFSSRIKATTASKSALAQTLAPPNGLASTLSARLGWATGATTC